jgi:hypothetical protein
VEYKYKHLNIKNGDKFNHFTVLNYSKSNKSGRQFLCKCVCGKELEVSASNLKSGHKKSCGCKWGENSRNDLIGQKFGRWTALKLDEKTIKNKDKKIEWICKCDCGTIKNVIGGDLINGRNTSCGCFQKENARKLQRERRKMFKEIPISFFTRIKICAKHRNRNIKVEIKIKDIYNQYLKQNKKCYYTGLNIGFFDDKPNYKGTNTHTASVDRIDSNKNYTKENICLVHKDINIMKMDFTKEQFIKYCKLISKNSIP